MRLGMRISLYSSNQRRANRTRMSRFFAPARYMMVKIMHSNFEVVLQTMKHAVIYLGSGPFSEVIALYLVV
jgi:hypothetical protein